MSGRSLSKVNSFKRDWDDEPTPTSHAPPSNAPSRANSKGEVINVDDSDDENAVSWPASPQVSRPTSSTSRAPFKSSAVLSAVSDAMASSAPPASSAPTPTRPARIATPDLSPKSRRRRAIFGDEEPPATTASSSSSSSAGPSRNNSTSAPKRANSGDQPWEGNQPKKRFAAGSAGGDAGAPSVVELSTTTKKNKKRPAKIELSDEQTKVKDMVVKDGLNVFFTGSAGTGKSVLLREIIKGLREKYRSRPDAVAVTASTGIAACNVGGTTLHSFAGIGLGIEPADQLAGKVKRNQKALSRWTRTKVLIMDEVSMVDGDLFDKLAKIATILRRDQAPFGGIQLVVTGDFFQLPPVSKGEPKFAFEARMWKESIARTVNLTQVFRQKDQTFVDMLNEMRFGALSQASIARFQRLGRVVEYADGIEPTELYPRREDVDSSNAVRLRLLKTESKQYHSQDGGSITDEVQLQKELSNMLAVKSLELKIECQVMLIKNLDDDLVNGSIGRVRGFYTSEDWPMIAKDFDNEVGSGGGMVVLGEELTRDEKKQKRMQDGGQRGPEFPAVTFSLPGGGAMTRLITAEEFKVEEQNGNVKASRTQLPLILSWAMSIHKSQGQTLERVKVDLRKIFEKGQAYVALSRATNLESLQVLNFDAKKVMCHAKVSKFSHSLEIIS